MRRLVRLVVTLAVTLAPLGACRSRGDGDHAPPTKTAEPGEVAPRQPHTAAGEAAQDFVQARDRLVAETKAKLAELDGKIDQLEAELASRSAEGKTEATKALDATIAALEARRVAARDALAQARDATADRWEQVKGKTAEALKSIDDAYRDAAEQLRR